MLKAVLFSLFQTFERALKFSFDEFHIWYQFALSLIGAEKVGSSFRTCLYCLKEQYICVQNVVTMKL